MNNSNLIKLLNENGVEREYGQIPDLWHVAELLREQGLNQQADDVIEVWHMAHDFKSVTEGQGSAKILEATRVGKQKDALPAKEEA